MTLQQETVVPAGVVSDATGGHEGSKDSPECVAPGKVARNQADDLPQQRPLSSGLGEERRRPRCRIYISAHRKAHVL